MLQHPEFARRRFAARIAGLLALGLAGCAGIGDANQIEVSQERLELALARRFPYNAQWMGLFDVGVSAPRLHLLPETNRIGTEIDVVAGERLFSRNVYRGSLSLNSGLRYEPGDRTLRLAAVRVDRFSIEGLPPEAQGQIGYLGSWLAERLLENQVIHTFREEDLSRLRNAGLSPGELRVTSRGLSIPLHPTR